MNQPAYGSYLIRMAPAESPKQYDLRNPAQRQAEPVTWRIEVKHIQGGHEYRFDSVDELLRWLREQADRLQALTQ